MGFYKLLGEPPAGVPSPYRGTYRSEPIYQEELTSDSPVNRAFYEYVSDHHSELASMDVALRIANEFERVGLGYDVVRVDVANERPGEAVPAEIGFDVTLAGDYSFLSWGLHWGGSVALPPPPSGPLCRLIEAHFKPLLNNYGLFTRWEDARFFLDVVLAESKLMPGSWESPDFEAEFQINRIVLVRPMSKPTIGNGNVKNCYGSRYAPPAAS